MPEWYDDDDDEAGQEDQRQSSVKSLRNQLKQVLADNKQLKADNEKLTSDVRKSNISTFFQTKGINPKLAKYVPVDIDPTEEALTKWVTDDGELFNIKLTPPAEKPAESPTGETGTTGTPEVPESVSDGWSQITNSTANALPAGKEEDLMAQISSASDMDALQKVLFSNGAVSGW